MRYQLKEFTQISITEGVESLQRYYLDNRSKKCYLVLDYYTKTLSLQYQKPRNSSIETFTPWQTIDKHKLTSNLLQYFIEITEHLELMD